MALLTDAQKNNFDTAFTAQYDDIGDNSILNPQPLQVDDTGSLLVTGTLGASMIAKNDADEQTSVKCDEHGALNVGGINITTIPDEIFSESSIVTHNDTGAINSAIQSMRYNLIQSAQTYNLTRMYEFTQTLTYIGGNDLLINVSAYFGN